MNGLERKEKEIGLVDLDKHETDKEKKTVNAPKRTVERQKNTIRATVITVLVCSLLLVYLGTRLCKMSLLAVGAVEVIEILLAIALNDSKLWVHIGIMVIEVVIGVVFGHALFLALAAIYYFVLLVALKLFGLEG